MPGPPIQVHIKRKATDDPVDLLHIQNEYNGIRQIKQYVFKRQRTSATTNGSSIVPMQPPAFANPHSTISFAGSRNVVSGIGSGDAEEKPQNRQTQTQHPNVADEIGRNEARPTITASEPRRFHLSRNAAVQTQHVIGSSYALPGHSAPAIFIERRRQECFKSSISGAIGQENANVTIPALMAEPFGRSMVETQSENHLSEQSKNPESTHPSVAVSAVQRPVQLIPQDGTLVAEMKAYAAEQPREQLQEVSRLITGLTPTPLIRARQPSSFKSKTSATRHHEIHLNKQVKGVKNGPEDLDEDMTDAMDVEGDDSNYVVDTYIRMPAKMFESFEQKTIGVLVLDSQPDIDQFYNDDSDSDSDIYDEEEDENAENHPSTDYPDEEVDSDDEYGRNPYLFQNRNASDNEEFDEDDATFSDDEEEMRKPPWARKSWMNRETYKEEDDAEGD